MRAPKVCSEPGCVGDAAPKSGKCAVHAELPWVRSERTVSPEWSKIRRRVLVRDRQRCVFCGRQSKIVDHRLPVAWGGTDEPANLQTMCVLDHKAKTREEGIVGRKIASGELPESAVDLHVMRWTPDLSIWGK